MRKLQAAGLLSALAVTLALGACGSDENATLNSASAGAVGSAIAASVAGAPASFTAAELGTGSAGGGFGFSGRVLPAMRWAGAAGVPGLTLQAPCPALDNTTDADGDGVLDDATYTFVQVDCTLGASYVKGAIHIVDPSASASVVGYAATFQNLLTHFENDSTGDFVQIGFNGTHGVLGTPDSAKLNENLTTSISSHLTVGNSVQTHRGSFNSNWTLDFIPAQGQLIVMDDSLPDGTFDVNGTFTYDVDHERFRMAVITQDLLVYDAACHAAGLVHPFDSGELRAHLVGENGQVYVRVVYGNCADPVVTFVGRTS